MCTMGVTILAAQLLVLFNQRISSNLCLFEIEPPPPVHTGDGFGPPVNPTPARGQALVFKRCVYIRGACVLFPSPKVDVLRSSIGSACTN
ncbi:hypothetical protein F5J12DRAFT_404746 [Pisolithus orientalis]|uniref:uncharacterized protein n=1 Tax=Pisolithus orientalis TaxID=936130 RepID=UPI002225AF16|nr:uncharacterized protein F5J12DRAFT_404746 [Pisolithus orientalis]KAI5995310.1 hypothetical protein F5J12DRAFT_404746 [Pisolithus orientalis]